MLQFVKNIFSREKPEAEMVVEVKYFANYKDKIKPEVYWQLIKEYESGDIVFEPIRKKLTEIDQEDLYRRIDVSEFLSCQERFEAMVGLMMLLDGSFPEPYIVSHLKKALGKDFMEIVEQKREECKEVILSKKVVRLIQWHKENRAKNIA